MPRPTSLRARLVLAAVATVVSLLVAAVAYRRLAAPPVDSVAVVDNRSRLDELLRGRSIDPSRLAPRPLDDERADVVREPLSLNTARVFFTQAGVNRPFNQDFYYARAPNLEFRVEWPEHPDGAYVVRTNSLGMREDEEVFPIRPDLRVIVTGDSHTDGVCSNDESFPARLEHLLAARAPDRHVEVLNAAAGGYSFYNYLGVFEHYRYLEPHVFVMAVYGGNDFSAMVGLQRYFHHRPPPHRREPGIAQLVGDDAAPRGIGAQELGQACHFADNPEDVAIAVETATRITRELDRLGRKSGIRAIVVYVPPPFRGQPHRFVEETRTMLARVGLDEEELAVSDRIADAWLAAVRESDVPVLDLRPMFRSAEECLYFRRDSHIDLLAHERIADALLPIVESVLEAP
ncbi:MAG: SGNH/GDSL hydrolase family protein, partial [Planctomycetota bacterium JB042]